MMEFRINKGHTTTKLNKHWQFSVGSDHAKQALRVDYLRQLKKVHDELGIQYVRFHGIFCDDMHTVNEITDLLPIPGMPSMKERSFYYCGAVYDNLLSIGMKPLVELSFMPTPLARDKEVGKMFYGSNTSLPESYEEWNAHIVAFIEYLIHRYGKEEIESWYFEVWNEPDIFVFYKGSQQDYFELYKNTVLAIKSVDEKIRVGGPAASGSRWIGDFVKYCKENDLPVDFISTHQYSGEPLTGVSGDEQTIDEEKLNPFEHIDKLFQAITPETTQLEVLRMVFGEPSEKEENPPVNVFRDNSAIVREQAGDLPVIYDEWNFSATFSDYSNDTIKAGAYIVKTALDVEKNVTGSSVWCFSDIFEEMRQFTEEFHGGFGLQTLNGIPKPTFYGLKMLCSLADNRIDLGPDATDGEIGIAAFEDEEKLQVLLFRQKMQQKDLPAERAEIRVELDTAPKSITLQRIDQDHCNPLKYWEAQGKPRDLTPAQVQDVIDHSSLVSEDVEAPYTDGAAILTADMGVNDVYLFTVEK